MLETPGTEEATGLSRVKCRAILDGKEGYATPKGQPGHELPGEVCCGDEVTIQKACEITSPEARAS